MKLYSWCVLEVIQCRGIIDADYDFLYPRYGTEAAHDPSEHGYPSDRDTRFMALARSLCERIGRPAPAGKDECGDRRKSFLGSRLIRHAGIVEPTSNPAIPSR